MAFTEDAKGRKKIDWKTGDPEGDRANYFKAMRKMIAEIRNVFMLFITALLL